MKFGRLRWCGTPEYMAPEIRNTYEPHDYRVDLWAMGVILYELLEGRLPFPAEEEEVEEEGGKPYNFARRFPLEFSKDLDIEAIALVDGLLQMDPEKRWSLAHVLEHSWIKQPKRRRQKKNNLIAEDDDEDESAAAAATVLIDPTTRRRLGIIETDKNEKLKQKRSQQEGVATPMDRSSKDEEEDRIGTDKIPLREFMVWGEREEKLFLHPRQKKKGDSIVSEVSPNEHYRSISKHNSATKICAWNISSFRSIVKQNTLHDYLQESKPDILFLFELRIDLESLNKDASYATFVSQTQLLGYLIHLNCSDRLGYSGVMVLTKTSTTTMPTPITIQKDMGAKNPKYNGQGRIVTLEYPKHFIVGVYAPNTGSNSLKFEFRTRDWDPDFLLFIIGLKAQNKDIIIIGDLNVCHTELDISQDLTSVGGGFSDQERSNFTKLLDLGGLVDTFRHFHSTQKKYSQWNPFNQTRTAGVGRRLDYALVSQNMLHQVQHSLIHDQVKGSDHCPIEILISLPV